MHRRSSIIVSQSAILLALVGGCSDSKNSSDSEPKFESDPARVQAALSSPIIDCQDTYAQCLGDAADLDAAKGCRDALADCLQTAADTSTDVSKTLLQCQSDGRECYANGGKASDCIDGYDSCAQGVLNGVGDDSDGGVALPKLPSHDGGLTLPDGTTITITKPNGGGLGLPKLPSGGGLSLPKLPSGGGLSGLGDGGLKLNGDLAAQQQCLLDLNTCVVSDPSQAQQCGDTARDCLGAP